MLRQPPDAPVALGYAADIESVQVLRRVWTHQLELSRTPRLGSLRATMRAWAGRISGRSDRRLIFALASATDAIASHCDHLVDRLASQEAKTADMTGAFGEEITHLRAEVIHLRSLVASLNPSPE